MGHRAPLFAISLSYSSLSHPALWQVSYAHALHGQEASHGLSPDELQAIEDAFRLAADMSDTVPENDDTEGDVEDEDEEDAEDQETLKTKRRVDIINLLLIATSVVIITMGSYARASYWWTGSLVSWGLWTSLCLLIIGCFLFFTALIGLTGAQLKSPTVLFIYTVWFPHAQPVLGLLVPDSMSQ